MIFEIKIESKKKPNIERPNQQSKRMNTPQPTKNFDNFFSKSDKEWMTSYFDASYKEHKDDEKNCRVAPSATHGNGVFATRDMKKGDKITLYPAHFVICDTKKGQVTIAPKKNPTEESTYYRLVARDGKCSVSGNPLIHHSHTAGHLLNDGGVVGSFAKDTIGADICRYILTTIQHENCDFLQKNDDKFMWVIASRDIKEGEELFVSYGLSYWLNSKAGVPVSTQKQMWDFIESVLGKAKTVFLMKKQLQSCGSFTEMEALERK